MAEKEPQFTVTDRRKFTVDGELRPGVVASEVPKPEAAVPVPEEISAPPAAKPAAAPAAAESSDLDADGELQLPQPTAQESADQVAAYKESSRGLDELIAQQNPRAKAPGEMTFDRLVQSVYMTAAIQLGAGGQPGEQPRVDILGARQSIDMLAVLTEKTKGNLTPNEERLLQSALFELRMSFLEITNAIATSAQQASQPGIGAAPGVRPGGKR
jgi:hypothetical protein